MLTLVSSQTYLEVARAQRARFEIEVRHTNEAEMSQTAPSALIHSFLIPSLQQKYKKMKRNVKAAEQDYRNRLAAVEGQLKTSESYKRKYSKCTRMHAGCCCCVDLLICSLPSAHHPHHDTTDDQVGVLHQQLDDLARKNKSMEQVRARPFPHLYSSLSPSLPHHHNKHEQQHHRPQVLVKLRAEGHAVPSIHSLPTPVSTPPPQYHNPPPMALPSPRLSSSGSAGGHSRHSSSNTKGGAYYHHQQHQQQHYMQQQHQQQHQHQQRGRSPSPSPHMAARPASYGGPGLTLPPGTPNSSTGSYHRRGGSAGPQGIPGFGGGGGGGGGGLASLLSPHRNAAAVVSSSSSSGPFGGGYPQQQQRSPSPGYGLGMRY